MTWTSESSRVPPEQQIRDSLIRSMDANGATPSTFLDLLDRVTKGGGDAPFRKLTDRQGLPFATFTAFVTAERPEGLGLHDKEDLRKHLTLQHKEEREPYLRQATVERMAAMRREVNRLLGDEVPDSRHQGRPPENERGTFISVGRPDMADKILARLKRDDPDEAQRVISGQKTANAAAREKGWRKPRVVLAKPETVASALIKHMPRDALRYIAQQIRKHLEDDSAS